MELNLDTLAAEVAQEYEGITLRRGESVIVLQPYLMLSKEKRKMIRKGIDGIADSVSGGTVGDQDEGEVVIDMLAMTADDPALWRSVAADYSLAVLMKIVNAWRKTIQLPEASDSQS